MTLKPGGEHPANHHLPPGWLRRILESNHHEGRIMTTWKLDLRTTDYDGPVDVLAALETTVPAVIAATLRAVADRLDPPHLGRTPSEGLAIITAAERREAADQRFREKLAGYGDTDAMVCPDCIGDRHTHQPGRCALPPPWNGVSVLDARRGTRAGACDQPGHGTAGCDCTPVVVDAPGDRMDAPDARLSAKAARRVVRDVEITRGPLAGMKQRRLVDPDTPRRRRPGRTVETDLDRAAKNDGCGPEHTHTGSCAYTVVERINPDA